MEVVNEVRELVADHAVSFLLIPDHLFDQVNLAVKSVAAHLLI